MAEHTKREITSLHNPAALARVALTRLAQTAMPPTPENYVREYRRASGHDEAADAQLLTSAAESTATLLALVETIEATTSGLNSGINRFGGDLRALVSTADARSPEGAQDLVENLTNLSLELQHSVEESQKELTATRTQLDKVTADLEFFREQARIDPLTQAVNRRGMEEIVVREIARSLRAQAPLALAIVDIDHFKAINDTHGHPIGDRALIHLVQTLKSGLRETDVVCRMGGEEFVLVLPASALQGALFVVDRLRVTVAKTPLVADAGPIHFSISAGVAQLQETDDIKTLLKRTDDALYAAKRGGRNRVYAG